MRDAHLRWATLCCAAVVVGCAGGAQINYESAPPDTMAGDVAEDTGDAAGLEQAEGECRRQGKHAVAQRVEGETVYNCAD
jgi:hypothetical protein